MWMIVVGARGSFELYFEMKLVMNSEPYLDVNRIAFPETLLELIEGVRGVSVKDIEMADFVAAEVRARHSPMEFPHIA